MGCGAGAVCVETFAVQTPGFKNSQGFGAHNVKNGQRGFDVNQRRIIEILYFTLPKKLVAFMKCMNRTLSCAFPFGQNSLLMYFAISIVTFSFFNPQKGISQQWITHTNGNNISAICAHENTIWVGTGRSGLVRIDRLTGKRDFYNTANSNLPNNVVTSIVVDDNKNVWLGTLDGLVKFDGANWQVYNTENSKIVDNMITSLLLEKGKILWFVSGWNRLIRFDGSIWMVYDSSNSPLSDSNSILDMAIDSKNRKWIGFAYHGMAVFDDANWTVYNQNNSEIPKRDVRCIAIDQNDYMWAGTNGGLIKFDGKEWSRQGPFLYEVYDITVDNNNNIWYGLSGGISRFDGFSDSLYTYTNSSLPGQAAYGIVVDNDNHIWAAIGWSGLFHFKGSKWKWENTSNTPLPSNNILSIAIDPSNTAWIGTGEGLVSYDGQKWSIYTTSNSMLPDNSVTTISIDKYGNQWIGTLTGIAVIKNQQWIVYPKLETGVIYAISFDSSDNPIIGTQHGAFKFDGESWIDYAAFNSQLAGSSIESIAVAEDNTQWFGTYKSGLFKFDGANWHHFNVDNSDLSDNHINSLQIDESGMLWIATSAGIHQVDGSNWISYTKDNTPFPDVGIRTFLKARNGDWWIAGAYGLSHRSGESWKYFDESNSGLPIGIISSIAIDSSDNKWIGTPYGLARYNANGVTSIPIENNTIPHQMALQQNYPNPFNSSTKIQFTLTHETNALLVIYNTLGQQIRTLIDSRQSAGQQSVQWDGLNDAGQKVASGVYVYQLRTDELVETRKMVLMP